MVSIFEVALRTNREAAADTEVMQVKKKKQT